MVRETEHKQANGQRSRRTRSAGRRRSFIRQESRLVCFNQQSKIMYVLFFVKVII
jgi:hypothetical protein